MKNKASNSHRFLCVAVLVGALVAPQIARGQETWSLQSPATKPLNRFDFGLVYDSDQQKTIMFGGEAWNFVVGNPFVYGDTWMWSSGNWTRLSPATSPEPRYNFAMAYDPAQKQILLYGGIDLSGELFTNTWAWNGNTWTQLATTGPPGRQGLAMAYDPISGKIILFGGFDSNVGWYGDTWTWDWTTNSWSQLNPTATPTARWVHRMVYDQARQQIMLFGGAGPTPGAISGTSIFNDTWTWNGTTWVQQSPITSPPNRYRHAMAYDPPSSQVIVFGGVVNNNCGADTWAWSGFNWTQLLPTTSPTCKEGAAMDYDVPTGQIVLFGGAGSAPADETWLFGNSTQTAVTINVPTGIQFTFAGTIYTGSQTINIAPGSYTVAVNSPQAAGTGTQLAFQSWSDGGAQSHSVTVGSSSVIITGTFQTQYLLTEVVSPLAGGSISPGSGYMPAGTVSLTPSANLGYAFAGWGGACSGTTVPCVLALSGPASVTANFTVTGFPVTVTVPSGATFTLNGTVYTTTATIYLPAGPYSLSTTSPQATVPGAHVVFLSWSDGGAQSHSINVAGPMTITGTFKKQYLLTTAAIPFSEGIVTVSGPGTSAPYYDEGSSITLTAVPNTNFEFDYWSVDCTGANPTCTFTISRPWTANAHFSVVENWVQLYRATNPPPPPRLNAAMAYDAMNQNVVMFGGLQGVPGSGATVLKDTWLWDGNTWKRQNPANSPSPRWAAMMAYDEANGTVVLYGGRPDATGTASLGLSDTWVWDLANNTWTQKSTTGPPRYEGSLAYDPQSKMVILFGGASGVGTWNDTWGWDGTTWKNLNPQTSPGARAVAAITYHATNQPGIVLFGGARLINPDGRFPGASELNDTWQWTGTNWVQRTPAQSPPVQATPTMAYNAATMETMLFESNPFLTSGGQQTWAWDGNNWFQKTPVSSPSNRDRQTVTYDAARNEVLVFGGINYATGRVFNDTWAWLAPVVSLVPQVPTLTSNGNGTYDVTIPLANTGNVPATNVSLISTAVGGATSNKVSTINVIDRGSSGSFTVKLQVSSVGASGTTVPAVFSGAFDADGQPAIPWTANFSVNLP